MTIVSSSGTRKGSCLRNEIDCYNVDMDITKLSKSIEAIVRGSYIPFQGVDVEMVVSKVQKHMNVPRGSILEAIEKVS